MARMVLGRSAATLAALVLAAVPTVVSAQDLSWSSAAEAAGDEVYVVFTEPSLLFGSGMGVRPLISVGAHYVVISDGDNSWGLTPAAGLRYQTDGGFIQGKVGWAIRPDEGGFDVFGGDESGLHTALHTEFYGDGTWGLQGIASYNWGADFLWSRARVTRRIAERSGGGGIALGAELVWQAVTDDDDVIDGNEYGATYIGPVLQFSGPGSIWALSGGVKMTDPGDDNTWYAKVELTLP
jgi:hypothetical protein